MQEKIEKLEGDIIKRQIALKECFSWYKRYEFLINKIDSEALKKSKVEELKSFDEFSTITFGKSSQGFS